MKSKFVKTMLMLFLVLSVPVLSSCSTNRAEELYETAQFEELQNNREHARTLYEDIVKKYPDSEYALKAKDRLSDLQKD